MESKFIVSKTITLSNEYVYGKNKHSISGTKGQAKIKLSKNQFAILFGSSKKGLLFYNKENITYFLSNLSIRWKNILENENERKKFKNPNLEKINQKINTFITEYAEYSKKLIEEEYLFDEWSKKRYALVTKMYREIIYYVAIPFETYIEILHDENNNIYLSFGIDYSLIKNSILGKQEIYEDILTADEKKYRKGQATLRDNLLKKHKKCQITELEFSDILVASHIKPWVISSEKEKIDLDNVLLLSATFDKLFDRGLMSFNSDGNIIFSDILPPSDIFKLNKIILNKKISFEGKQQNFMSFHRKEILRCINGPIILGYEKE